MKNALWLVLFAVSIFSCTDKTLTYEYAAVQEEKSDDPERAGEQMFCDDWQSIISDTIYAKYQPLRRLRVNVHYVDRTDSCCNLKPGEGETFAANMLYAANNTLEDLHELSLPLGNDLPALPKHFKYQLEKDDSGKPKVFYHYNDDLYYYIHKGPYQNNYNRTVINKYRTGGDSTMNIFILPHHPDSLLKRDYIPRITGIALGRDMKVAGIIENGKPWEATGPVNHETGHILSLRHTWGYNDGCEDTPTHPNCWNYTKTPPCDTMVSNNMMDYNAYQTALSPCQIGRIQQKFAEAGSNQRKLLIRDWCELDKSSEIKIAGTSEWNAPLDLDRSIRIMPGGTLTIRCRINMPPGGRITVEPGGTLVLDQAWLRNDCGKTWDGIFLGELGKETGNMKTISPYRIDHLNDYIPKS
jgi:hypothetical protein